MSHLIAPSILAADFANLGSAIEMLNKSAADRIHIDIMDGVFVPNISFGFPVLEAIKKHTSKILDVHLMIIEPERYVSRFKEAGADTLIVHIEACKHLNRTLQTIKENGMKAGIALNPHTSVNHLEDVINVIDEVLIMSVNPGFGGQKFIENTYRKVERTKDLIIKSDSKALIGVDGGVDLSNALKLQTLGVDILVAGSSVFGSANPIQAIATFKDL